MPGTRASGAGCVLRALLVYGVFAFVCVLVPVVIGYLTAPGRLQRADDAWAAATEPMDAFIARYPKQPHSDAARKLDELTRPLGIRMVFRASDPSKWTSGNDEILNKKLGDFLRATEHGGNDELPPAPPECRAFLEKEGARIDGIEAHILHGGPLRWEQDFDRGMAAPFPSLLGHRQLHNVLLTRAREAARLGQPAGAEQALEASWVLSESIGSRPELISRLIVVAMAQMQHGVLRVLKAPPPRWLPRMREQGFTRGLRSAWQLEAWNWRRFGVGFWGIFDVNDETPSNKPLPLIGRVLTAPYVRWSVAGISKGLLDATEELSTERRCDVDMERHSKQFEESFPRWNILARIGTPSAIRGWTAMRLADFDRELTERVLLARAERASSGRWPNSSIPSGVCAGIVWQQTGTGSGSLTLRPEADPFPEGISRWDWSITLRP